MMDNHHKRTFAEEDRITNLSEDLINPILERLPVKDAVRTSVLSKKWRYRWTTMRTLSLDDQFFKNISKFGAYHHNGFVRIINKIMIHHKGPIFKFDLCIPFSVLLDSFQEVDQWMLILSRNSVRELHIMNSNPIYRIPSSVYSCLELRVLVLYRCFFKPPLEFQGFPNLEELFFKNVILSSNLGGRVINLPQLKKLTLQNCHNVDCFNIKAVRLQTLNVFSCRDVRFLPLMRSEHLNLGMMLRNLPNLACITTDGYVLKVSAVEKVPKISRFFTCIMELEFQRISFGDLDQLQGALYMLRNSSNLKVLRVTHVQKMGPEDDLELTSNYLKSTDCLDQTLCMLQTVEMTSFEGSRPELLFIKLLLDHSPNLKNMVIQPRAMADVQKMLNIAKDVMLFPRASTKAKMVYLDPKL